MTNENNDSNEFITLDFKQVARNMKQIEKADYLETY